MAKRPRDSLDNNLVTATPVPPAKRMQMDPPGSSPFSSGSSAASTPFSIRTPRTPFSIPSDSPSNPFGLKKSLVALELPKPISYSKHVVLRFQYMQEKSSAELPSLRAPRKPLMIYRIAQVPTNYSFRHLHKLIFFLFATDSGRHHSIRQPTPRAVKGKAKAVSRAMSVGRTPTSGSKRKPMAGPSSKPVLKKPESWKGHVFEVYKANKEHGLVSDAEDTKGMVLPTGKLWRKLSSVRERHIFRDLYDASETGPAKADDGEDSDEEDGWAWEAEDDFLLSHLWPKGPTLQNAIIYRHNSTTSIHIAVHKGSVPPRKGVGNLPYVFWSQGSAGDTLKISHDIHNHRKREADDSDSGEGILTPPSSVVTPAGQINRWNALGTFARFLQGEDDRERKARGFPSRDCENTDPSSEGSLPLSEDVPFPTSDVDSDSDYTAFSDSVLFPFASSAITPFPAHPAHRKRVQSAERRLERLTRSGLSRSRLSDEEDEEPKKASSRAQSVEIPDEVVVEIESDTSDSPGDFNPFIDLVNDEVEI